MSPTEARVTARVFTSTDFAGAPPPTAARRRMRLAAGAWAMSVLQRPRASAVTISRTFHLPSRNRWTETLVRGATPLPVSGMAMPVARIAGALSVPELGGGGGGCGGSWAAIAIAQSYPRTANPAA